MANRYREFIFIPFDFHWLDTGFHWWVSLIEIQVADWNGSILHIEYDMGQWKFDFLFLRSLFYGWRYQ